MICSTIVVYYWRVEYFIQSTIVHDKRSTENKSFAVTKIHKMEYQHSFPDTECMNKVLKRSDAAKFVPVC